MFDVTMGSFDGTEICELVVLYIIGKLCPTMQVNVGLYRDDVLAVAKNVNGPKLNKFGKEITVIFKAESLSVTIETNLIKTDF